MPTPPAGGQEISFAPQMIFLWPPARGVGKLSKAINRFQGILLTKQSEHHHCQSVQTSTNRQRRNAAKQGCQSLCQPQRNHIIKKSWLKQWRTFSMMEPERWWNVWMWDILQKKEPPHSLTLHYKWPPWHPAEGKYKYGAVFSSALQTIKTGRKIGKIIFKIKSKSLRITTTRIAYRRTLTKVLKTEKRSKVLNCQKF